MDARRKMETRLKIDAWLGGAMFSFGVHFAHVHAGWFALACFVMCVGNTIRAFFSPKPLL